MQKRIGQFPNCVAIVADGNGRWATARGLPRIEGHRAGAENIENIVKYLLNKGIGYVILYGFSTENWGRSGEEIAGLFGIIEEYLGDAKFIKRCIKNGVRIFHMGRRDRLPKSMMDVVDRLAILTEDNEKINVGICLDYGSRDELEMAARSVRDFGGKLADYLYSGDFPDVDLVIRTGGEKRLSNFMLYQSAYAELYFTDVYFPDLNAKELDKALDWYYTRVRTKGGQRKTVCF